MDRCEHWCGGVRCRKEWGGHELHEGRDDGSLTWWSQATEHKGETWPDDLEPDAVIPVRWTSGDIPSDGMVLVDAQTLRKAITRVQAKDALHPAGECRCGYQGECAWCQMDEWRNRATIAEENAQRCLRLAHDSSEAEASIRKRWADLGTAYNAERERRQLAEKSKADADRRAMVAEQELARMRAAAAMAPEGLDSVHVAVSPEAVDEVLDGVDQDERPTCATVGGETGGSWCCSWALDNPWPQHIRHSTTFAPPPPHTEAP